MTFYEGKLPHSEKQPLAYYSALEDNKQKVPSHDHATQV